MLRSRRGKLSSSTTKARPRGGLEPTPIGARSVRACRAAATPSVEKGIMRQPLQTALLSLSLLFWGLQASTTAAAQEHDRGRSEQRPEARGPEARGPAPSRANPPRGGLAPNAGR